MSENNYAFAVAQIRSYENSLLGKTQYDQIIAAPDLQDVFDLLSARGWQIPENAAVSAVLDERRAAVWELISGLAKGAPELRVFTVNNDYHNLKTAIKAFFGETEAAAGFIQPASVDTAVIETAVKEKKYDTLPGRMAAAAAEAYEALVTTEDGQTADIIIDRYTLSELSDLAAATNSETVKRYCRLAVEAADIKTAYRGAITKKSDDFYEKALCGTAFLDKKALARAARKGAEEVLSFLSSAGFQAAAAAIKTSVSAFEKWYDEQVLSVMQDTVYINFGIEPLIAYGFKTENEIKNLRIALTCKSTGAETAEIKERMRVAYV